MKKNFILGVFLIGLFVISFVSAGWFSDSLETESGINLTRDIEKVGVNKGDYNKNLLLENQYRNYTLRQHFGERIAYREEEPIASCATIQGEQKECTFLGETGYYDILDEQEKWKIGEISVSLWDNGVQACERINSEIQSTKKVNAKGEMESGFDEEEKYYFFKADILKPKIALYAISWTTENNIEIKVAVELLGGKEDLFGIKLDQLINDYLEKYPSILHQDSPVPKYWNPTSPGGVISNNCWGNEVTYARSSYECYCDGEHKFFGGGGGNVCEPFEEYKRNAEEHCAKECGIGKKSEIASFTVSEECYKPEGDFCKEDHECTSGVCLEGKCTKPNFLKRISNFFKNLF